MGKNLEFARGARPLFGLLATLGLAACVSDFGNVSGSPDCVPFGVTAAGRQLYGIEDLTADSLRESADPFIFLSATERRAWIVAEGELCDQEPSETDGVFVIRLSDIASALEEGTFSVDAKRLVGPRIDGRLVHPHGLGLSQSDGTEQRRLFIVDHPSGCRAGTPPGDTEVKYVTRIVVGDLDYGHGIPEFRPADPIEVRDDEGRYCSANDIAPIDRNRFFISHDSGHCSDFLDGLDLLLDRAVQNLVYYDGDKFHAVADGFAYINGLAISRDGLLYVSDTRRANIRVFDVKDLKTKPAGAIREGKAIAVEPGLDNLEWGSDGAIYAAAHPDPVRFALYGKLATWLVKTSPTALLRIDPEARGKNYALLAADDGRTFSAASASLRIGKLLISGAVFDRGLLVCKLEGSPVATLKGGRQK